MALIWIPKKLNMWDYIRSLERDRPRGKPVGSHIADTTWQRMSVLLCSSCRSKFDYKKNNYYPVSDREDMYAGGRCEDCRITSDQLFLYMPEEKVSQLIVTRDEERHRARHATNIGV